MPTTLKETQDQKEIMEVGLTKQPLGPGFSAEELTGATNLKLVGSSFSDPGDDWIEYHLTLANGDVTKRRVGGY